MIAFFPTFADHTVLFLDRVECFPIIDRLRAFISTFLLYDTNILVFVHTLYLFCAHYRLMF